MITAHLVARLPDPKPGITHKLWRLSSPVSWTERDKMLGIDDAAGDSPLVTRTSDFVVTSKANHCDFGFVHETFIFPADSTGKILDFCELPGSERGEVSHEEVIANAGWTIIPAPLELLACPANDSSSPPTSSASPSPYPTSPA